LIEYLALAARVHDTGAVWVQLYNGAVLCLIDVVDEDTFKAKLLPTSKRAREYRIAHRDIKGFYNSGKLRKKRRVGGCYC
jgi:hypothetical protein